MGCTQSNNVLANAAYESKTKPRSEKLVIPKVKKQYITPD
jgi:hypothetical protein